VVLLETLISSEGELELPERIVTPLPKDQLYEAPPPTPAMEREYVVRLLGQISAQSTAPHGDTLADVGITLIPDEFKI
jgi:hypothetical protein